MRYTVVVKIWPIPEIVTRVPPHQEVSQMGNSPKISLGSYQTPEERESQAQLWDAHRPQGEDPSFFFPQHPKLPDSTLTPIGYSSAARFSKHKTSYDVTISPHSKYSSISAGTVLNIAGYLGMPIPIVVHNHQSDYERISTCKSRRSEKSTPSVSVSDFLDSQLT